jgi:hypothetical protein
VTDPRPPRDAEPFRGAPVAPDAADRALLERVRRRLMKSIADDSAEHHVVVTPDQGRWLPFMPGIARKVLHDGPGVMCYLLRFAPGAVLPAHRHPIDEECVVLEGSVRIGARLLPAGSFQRVPQDILEGDATSDGGAVTYLRGATPQAEHLL